MLNELNFAAATCERMTYNDILRMPASNFFHSIIGGLLTANNDEPIYCGSDKYIQPRDLIPILRLLADGFPCDLSVRDITYLET